MNKIKPKWDVDEAECNTWYIKDVGIGFVRDFEKIHGKSPTVHMTVLYYDRRFKWCTLHDENIEVGRYLVDKMQHNRDYADAITNKFMKNYKEYTAYLKKIRSLDLEKIENKGLFRILRKLRSYFQPIWPIGLVFEPANEILHKAIESELKKYGCDTEKILAMIDIPEKSFMQQEKEDLLRIALEKKRRTEKIKEHKKKYYWLLTGHAGKVVIDDDFFIKKMDEILKSEIDVKKEIDDIKNYKKNIVEKKRRIINKYEFDKKVLNLIYAVGKLGPMHDKRKELFMKSVYAFEDVIEEIAKRYKYRSADLKVLDLDEILAIEKGKTYSKAFFKERHGLVIFYMTKNVYRIITGEKAKEMERKEFSTEYVEVHEIEGMCASPGKARGKVKVIIGISDVPKMKKGDILVSGVTRPELVVAIKKAAAIVTDEGGVTCHAAIVSRELKIPCVIGTKFATKVLHDDDLVEVDADKGVVRKISE